MVKSLKLLPSDVFPRLKICQKCVCGRAGPRWGSLQCSPRPLAGFKGPTSKGRGGEGREGWMGGKRGAKGRGGEGEGKRREGKGREGGLTPNFLYPPPPLHTITNRANFHVKVSN